MTVAGRPAGAVRGLPGADAAGAGVGSAGPVGADGLAAGAGHRLVPHTADCIIEAWGPDRATCLAEALQGLVEEFAEVGDRRPRGSLDLRVGPCPPEEALVSLLEDVIYALEVFSVVPVRVELSDAVDGGLCGSMDVVPVDEISVVGPAPKAVSYHDLAVGADSGGWRCRVLVDV